MAQLFVNAQGADRYRLGSTALVFYRDGNDTPSEEGDFALLKDFQQAQGDKRVLAGTTGNYHLMTQTDPRVSNALAETG